MDDELSVTQVDWIEIKTYKPWDIEEYKTRF